MTTTSDLRDRILNWQTRISGETLSGLLAEYRDAVLEEAADICDFYDENLVLDIAERIRSLKGNWTSIKGINPTQP